MRLEVSSTVGVVGVAQRYSGVPLGFKAWAEMNEMNGLIWVRGWDA